MSGGWAVGRLGGEDRGVRSFRFCKCLSFFGVLFFVLVRFFVWLQLFSSYLLNCLKTKFENVKD